MIGPVPKVLSKEPVLLSIWIYIFIFNREMYFVFMNTEL